MTSFLHQYHSFVKSKKCLAMNAYHSLKFSTIVYCNYSLHNITLKSKWFSIFFHPETRLQNERSASSALCRKLVVLSYCFAYRENASSVLKTIKELYFILTSDLQLNLTFCQITSFKNDTRNLIAGNFQNFIHHNLQKCVTIHCN